MAAVAGRRTVHQRSNSAGTGGGGGGGVGLGLGVGASSVLPRSTATRNNRTSSLTHTTSHPSQQHQPKPSSSSASSSASASASSASTRTLSSSSSLPTHDPAPLHSSSAPVSSQIPAQQHKLVSKSSVTSTSSTNTATTSKSRRRLSSTRRDSSASSATQSGLVSPLSPSISVSGRRDSGTTIVSALTSPIVSKRHSLAPSTSDTSKARSSVNPLPSSVASNSSISTSHTRRSSTGTTTSSRKTQDTSLPRASAPPSRPSGTSVTGLTKDSKPSHRRANSTVVSSRTTPSIPSAPVTAASLRSLTPPSAPPPPEAPSCAIPPLIQAELEKNASLKLSHPPKRTRGPARFSTNGIATINGPPPSLAYRQLALSAPSPPPPAIPPPPLAPQPPPPQAGGVQLGETFQYLQAQEDNTSTALVLVQVNDHVEQYQDQQSEQSGDSIQGVEDEEISMSTYENATRFARSNGGVLNNGFSGQYHARVEDDEPTVKDLQRVAQQDRGFSSSPDPSPVRTPGSQSTDDPFLNLARSSTPRSQALLDAQARQEKRRTRMMQYSVTGGRTSALSNEYASARSALQRSTTATTISDDSTGGVEISPMTPTSAYERLPDAQSLDVDHSLSHRASFLRRQREGQNGHARSVSEIPRTTITRTNGIVNELPSQPTSSIPTNLNPPKSSIGSLIEGDRAQNAAAARLGVNDDAQSTISSGTVWDELDELKLRIKRLELTGTLPPASSLSGVGSGISNSSGDRPRTGTTAATTISNSPRHQNQQIAAEAAAPTNGPMNTTTGALTTGNLQASGPPPTIHPVLHAALAKTKTVLPDHIIKALDALASDTLTLAQSVGSTGTSTMSISAVVNSPEKQLVTDRQVRRKVDNICRSLTELCVALADGRMPFEPTAEETMQVAATASQQAQMQPLVVPQQTQQPPYQLQQLQAPLIQQQPPPPPNSAFSTMHTMRMEDPVERTTSAFDYRSPSVIGHRIDREATVTPNSAARAHARFEARRASILGAPSPQYISRQEASPSPQPGMNRLSHRNSMSLRGQRAGTVELEDSLEIPQAPFRSPSRASTDLNGLSGGRPQPSPMRAEFSSSGYENSPLQRTLTLREQRMQQQHLQQQQQQQQQLQVQQSPNMGNLGLPVPSSALSNLAHRRHYSTANVTPPREPVGLGIQRRSYLDRGTNENIGTALTTSNGLLSTSGMSQAVDIGGRRRTEYLRGSGAESEMAYSPPTAASVTGPGAGPNTTTTGRARTSSVSSRVGSVRNRTGLLASSYTGRMDTGVGLGRDRLLNTTRR